MAKVYGFSVVLAKTQSVQGQECFALAQDKAHFPWDRLPPDGFVRVL